MKYQALKRLKTKTKLIKMCDTLQEAHDIIKQEGGKFHSFSYIGSFPVYQSEKHTYNIQGAIMLDTGGYIVCSLNEDKLKAFNFNN